ncbi:MAG: hypothetical protein JXA66_08755 [Oligoflexia bacterium]|nr:hypothetical protein [Oligoflexia bacterium]
MSLEQIIFNHDKADFATSAINIRKNMDIEGGIPPEWVKGNTLATESPAAYALAPISGNDVKIIAVFDPNGFDGDVEIQALNGGILGALSPEMLSTGSPNPDNPGLVDLEFVLSNHTMKSISLQDIQWQWQYRPSGGGAWTDLETTSHRIYVILDLPETPWINAANNNHNPWTDVLDEICPKVLGQKDKKYTAARLLTRLYNELGVQYDVGEGDGIGGQSAYLSSVGSDWGFDPIDFINKTNGDTVNCNDCATAYNSFASILGIEVEQMFHQTFGYLNNVVPIGRGECNHPFYLSDAFNLHDPIVGPDEVHPDRAYFKNHGYCRYNDKNYDLTMKSAQVAPDSSIAALILVWLLLFILTLGKIGTEWLTFHLNKANGWLIDIAESDYRDVVIDISTEPETKDKNGNAFTHNIINISLVLL